MSIFPCSHVWGVSCGFTLALLFPTGRKLTAMFLLWHIFASDVEEITIIRCPASFIRFLEPVVHGGENKVTVEPLGISFLYKGNQIYIWLSSGWSTFQMVAYVHWPNCYRHQRSLLSRYGLTGVKRNLFSLMGRELSKLGSWTVPGIGVTINWLLLTPFLTNCYNNGKCIGWRRKASEFNWNYFVAVRYGSRNQKD